MSKRKSIKVAGNNGAKVAKLDKEGKEDDDEKEVDRNICFICQTQGSEKLQSSSNARSISASKASNDLADRVQKFYDMNLLPVPLKMNKLRRKLELGDSLTLRAVKFHKSCKLKFGNKKLDKAMKKFEKKTRKSGESSTSQARGNY